MPTIAVIIPHGRHDDPSRDRVREWITARYRDVHELPTRLALCPTAEWSKGAAVNPVIEASTADIVIVADADSYVDDVHLQYAIESAEGNGWAVPHSIIKRLNRVSTQSVLEGTDGPRRLERGSYPARTAGGIVVARADVWAAVRGIDPRFYGWGGEDHALWFVFHALIGPVNHRQGAPLWHLWHPPAPRWQRPSRASRDLAERYKSIARRRAPEEMAQLVREW